MTLNLHETIVVLDFGSQYTQLIARRVRELKVFSVILPFNTSLEKIQSYRPIGIIFSGGPANVYQRKAPLPSARIFDLSIPVLGICYGMQLMGHLFQGKVKKMERREFGFARLRVDERSDLFYDLPEEIDCWMSHGDQITEIPEGFEVIGHTDNSPIAAIRNKGRRWYGVQFHPEVIHTPEGKEILRNFLYRISGARGEWTAESFIEESVLRIREQVDGEKILLGLSGGVDSSTAAFLIHRAIGRQLVCVFVDNGLLRLDEGRRIKALFSKRFDFNMRFVSGTRAFLSRLRQVTDPERKRKIIGRTFIEIFEKEAKKVGPVRFLAQGTLYPDVIESVSAHGGPTSVIKSHHNVGGLPRNLKFKLIEPLRELFKDEVREVGKVLGVPQEILERQPFPGPGLAVRIIGEVTHKRLGLLRQADWIVVDEIKKAGLYSKLWQSFAVLLPIKSVGVMGDERTYEHVAAIRAVHSLDGMTADWAELPSELLKKISNRVINEVRGINRVCYDVSSKPPSTIEWE